MGLRRQNAGATCHFSFARLLIQFYCSLNYVGAGPSGGRGVVQVYCRDLCLGGCCVPWCGACSRMALGLLCKQAHAGEQHADGGDGHGDGCRVVVQAVCESWTYSVSIGR